MVDLLCSSTKDAYILWQYFRTLYYTIQLQRNFLATFLNILAPSEQFPGFQREVGSHLDIFASDRHRPPRLFPGVLPRQPTLSSKPTSLST